ETQLGVPLIDRTKRPFVVTREGEAFYTAARAILESWEKAKTEVPAVRARVDGTVRVAAIYSVGLHDVSRPMQQFMSLYPDARVQLECLHPHKVVEAVITGEADVGIMSYPPPDRALSVVPLREEPMALVCHPNHRLARRRVVPPAELAGEAFVAFDAGLTIRKAIDRALRQHNVRVNIVMEFDNIETIKQAIIIAAGVSILPRHTVQKEASIRALVAEAIERMLARRQAGVLVVDAEGRLIGIFTERDVLMRVAGRGRDARQTRLAEVMTRDPEALGVNDRVAYAVHSMSVAGYRTVP